MDTARPHNRLIHETSPYLLQHAHNPVDWYPWGTEALERARREDKPILVSIGYSACHWCHVMEHESFEDAEVAGVTNALFVCIKVDREERPDLDKIYQLAHQFLTNRPGGWPLNMFLTPAEHMPFFGGTYFPRTSKYGMPGFTEILRRVAAFYKDQRQEIEAQNAALQDLFARLQPQDPSGARLDHEVLATAATQLKRQFDPRFGGFGDAPKFPHPGLLEFCLRYWAEGAIQGRPDNEMLHVARYTLKSMAWGGLYDQLGGGFCRYSVDERWEIPHFEKMLYDNAQLLPLYADAFLATGTDLFRQVALETGEWVLREMQAPDGGYYSTLDADSEGEEGRFYVWRREEIDDLLTPAERELTTLRFGLDRPANFEGRWHLHVHADTAAIAAKHRRLETEVETLLASARTKLFRAREQRVRPGRDDKILTSWNGLMIKGLARAGRLLGRQDFMASAERAFDFLRTVLWQDGRLLVTTKDGKAHLNAYLDDYVFLIDGGLELLQARWREGDLDFIMVLADYVLEHFEDRQQGGFYFTSDDHERLLHRPKPTSDDAIPSGNGVAAVVMSRLGHLLGETKYLVAAERTLETMSASIAHFPSAHGSLLIAAMDYLNPTETVVIRGPPAATASWLERCHRRYAPQRVAYAISGDANPPGRLAERRARGEVTAYVCSGQTCSAPAVRYDEFEPLIVPTEVPVSTQPTTGGGTRPAGASRHAGH